MGSKPVDLLQSQDEVYTAIKSALDGQSIEIPFPHRTLTFNGPVPLEATKNGATYTAG